MTMRASTLAEIGAHIANGHDHVTLELDSMRTLVVTVEGDSDASPSDYDCYDATDHARFSDGEWSFVGLVVALRDARTASETTASLWGIERGLGKSADEAAWFTEVVTDLTHEVSWALRMSAARASEAFALLTSLTQGVSGSQTVEPELSTDEVEALGLDSTGRDGHPEFPYRASSPTVLAKRASLGTQKEN